MQKISVIHMCLVFQNRHKKYVYGLTYSMLTSNYLSKYKPDYIIIPSMPYTLNMFMHAGMDQMLDKLLKHTRMESGTGKRRSKAMQQVVQQRQKQQQPLSTSALDKIIKNVKLIQIDTKALQFQYNAQKIRSLKQTNLLTHIKEHQLQQVMLIDILAQQIKTLTLLSYNSNNKQQKGGVQLLDWINGAHHELKIIVTQIGMSTYVVQGNNILVVDPTQEYLELLANNRVIGTYDRQKYRQLVEQEIPTLLQLVHTVIVTKLASVTSLLALMIVEPVQLIRVIVVSQQLQQSIIFKAHRYLHMPQEIVRSRLLIRNIGPSSSSYNQHKAHRYCIFTQHINPYILQSYSTLSCVYHGLTEQSPQLLELQFGSSATLASNKRIYICSAPTFMASQTHPEPQINHMPHDLQQVQVQFVMMYRMGQGLAKQLKALPQQLRKKIIYNRNQHKYNHKYFYSFEKGKVQSCTVTDTQYISMINSNAKISKNTQLLSMLQLPLRCIKQKNIDKVLYSTTSTGMGCRLYELGNLAVLETVGQAIQIVGGYVLAYRYQANLKKQSVQVVGASPIMIDDAFKVVALKHAHVRMMLLTDYQIANNYNKLQTLSHLKQHKQHALSNSNSITNTINNTNTNTNIDNLMITNINVSSTHTNSIELQPINMIHTLLDIQHLSSIQDNTLIASLSLAQKQQLNAICHPITYEVGFKTNNRNQNIYFISKGGMKWEDSDRVAGNAHFIGDLVSFYQMREHQGLQFDNHIQVIKDTWALLINIQEFHKYFILHNPHLLYRIFHKGKIFN